MSLVSELQRRNVFRVAAAYVVLSWLLMQVADTLGSTLTLPDWTGRLVFLLLAMGFIPAMIFSWVYELTPEGVKKESEIDRSQSITQTTGRKLDVAVLVMLIGVLVVYFVDPKGSMDSTGSDTVSSMEVEPEPVSTPAGPRAIAVLPFADLSPDGDQAYFADGIAEEILNLLARIPDLSVIARTSAFKFRGEDTDLREVGRALNARHILEGSVRTAGTRVRITAQLIDAQTNLHLWSETYDRELIDIFAVQDEIAEAITAALGVELGITTHATEHHAIDTEAYRLYLQGRKAWAERPQAGRLEEALDLLERSVALDPDLDVAHGALALAHTISPYYQLRSYADALPFAQASAERALEINPQNGDALLAMGYLRGVFELNLIDGERRLLESLELRPNDLTTINLIGDFYRSLRDEENALKFESRAAELDPLDPIQQSDLAWTRFAMGDWKNALATARQALALAPDHPAVPQVEIWSLLFLGRAEEARARLRVLEQAGFYSPYRIALDRVLLAMATGSAEDVEAQFAEAIRVLEEDPLSSERLIALYMIIGDVESAAEILQALSTNGNYNLTTTFGVNALSDHMDAAGIEIDYPEEIQQWIDRRRQGSLGRWWVTDELVNAGYSLPALPTSDGS